MPLAKSRPAALPVQEKPKENGKINSIEEYVEESVDNYLRSLNGQPPHGMYRLLMRQVEPGLLRSVLEYCEGNKTLAARLLGISRLTLKKKLDTYGMSAGSK